MEATYFKGIPNLESFTLSKDNPLVFTKEVIYESDFSKDGNEFSVDVACLDHWHNSITTFKEAGIKIPLPLGHVDDPEANRGEIIGSERKLNKNGLESFYVKLQFRDEEAAKLAQTSDISLYSPNTFTDGNGTVHQFPIRHVAITDYPVIPKLEGFEVIAASFITPKLHLNDKKDKVNNMVLKVLAVQCGLSLSSDLEDAKIEEAIVLGFKDLSTKLAEATKPVGPIFKPTSSMVSMLKENRELKLSQLVKDHNITPAVATDLIAAFCNEGCISLSLSDETDTTSVLFNVVIKALAKNEPVIKPEGSGLNTGIRLSHDDIDDVDKNPLAKSVARRIANRRAGEVAAQN